MAEDIPLVMLFMLMPRAGLACCCAKEELPIPGLLGAMAGKEEFRVLRELSGVIVLLVP